MSEEDQTIFSHLQCHVKDNVFCINLVKYVTLRGIWQKRSRPELQKALENCDEQFRDFRKYMSPLVFFAIARRGFCKFKQKIGMMRLAAEMSLKSSNPAPHERTKYRSLARYRAAMIEQSCRRIMLCIRENRKEILPEPEKKNILCWLVDMLESLNEVEGLGPIHMDMNKGYCHFYISKVAKTFRIKSDYATHCRASWKICQKTFIEEGWKLACYDDVQMTMMCMD